MSSTAYSRPFTSHMMLQSHDTAVPWHAVVMWHFSHMML